MVTCNPAAVIRRGEELGTLAPGRIANVSVLRVAEGEFELSDGFETLSASQCLQPVGCVRAGTWIAAA